MIKPRSLPTSLLYILPLAFLGVFFFYPLGAIAWRSFAPSGVVDLTPITRLWSKPYFQFHHRTAEYIQLSYSVFNQSA